MNPLFSTLNYQETGSTMNWLWIVGLAVLLIAYILGVRHKARCVKGEKLTWREVRGKHFGFDRSYFSINQTVAQIRTTKLLHSDLSLLHHRTIDDNHPLYGRVVLAGTRWLHTKGDLRSATTHIQQHPKERIITAVNATDSVGVRELGLQGIRDVGWNLQAALVINEVTICLYSDPSSMADVQLLVWIDGDTRRRTLCTKSELWLKLQNEAAQAAFNRKPPSSDSWTLIGEMAT